MPSGILDRFNGILGAAALALWAALPATPAAASTMVFENACSSGDRVTIAAVGDLLFHRPMQIKALAKGGSYRQFWAPLEPVLKGADLTYANLEGTAAHGVAGGGSATKDPGRRFDGRVYGARAGALYFNYHPSLLDDLQRSGVDVVSTANNHAMDRRSLGADRTIDNLESRRISFTGTRRKGEISRRWSTVTRANGMSVAWLACTYDTNGNPDRHAQVLLCHDQREELLGEVRRLASDPQVDAVIVTPHWGIEKASAPAARDQKLGADLILAGAAAVIGSHPHVVQGWKLVRGADGHEGPVIYSTGNFVSNQRSPAQRTGIAAILELTKGAGAGGKAKVTAAGWLPTWVEWSGRTARRVVANPGRGESMQGLRRARRLLPEGNELTMRNWRALPRVCTPPLVAARALSSATAAATAAMPVPGPKP